MMKNVFTTTKGITILLAALAAGCNGADMAVTQASGLTAPPPVPTDFEAKPTSQTALPITLNWTASSGATSYNIYRATSAGAEGSTPYATATTNTYVDSNVSAGPPLLYYYTVAAVGPGGTSAQSVESVTPTPLKTSPGSGNVAGVTSGSKLIFYGKDGLGGGYDWFNATPGQCTNCPDWFPQWLNSQPNATAPGGTVVDMAYADQATLTFNNVVVSTAGLYNVDIRYAFGPGLFPSVTNRQMGLKVNGVVFTSTMRFTLTGSFTTYQDSTLQVNLKAGQNSIVLFAVTDHGISRVDTMTLSPASASAPAAPTNLTAVAASGTTVALAWTGSTGATSYNVYRGTVSDGEALTAIATTNSSTTSFVDSGLTSGTTYFYNLVAVNSVGISPDSNEVSIAPVASGPPPVPAGVSASAGNGQVTVSWSASGGATSYNLFRSTTAGGEGTTPIVTGVTTTSYTNTGLANGTKYFYKVSAVNGSGASAQSAEVSATPSVPASGAISIACGNSAVGTFVADTDFSGGSVSGGTTTAIDTSHVTNPAPMSVYQHGRKSASTYTLPGFAASSSHTVRLHFAEYFHTAAGQRKFNVLINGTQVLTNFDVFATAGAEFRANIQSFTAVANGSGQIVIQFTNGAADLPLINGIEVN
jgi:fibronectin type 3 domain-containing protein